MEPKEIRQSNLKVGCLFATCLSFTLVFVFYFPDSATPQSIRWLGAVFFGLASLIFAILILRPQRLLLDHSGFTIVGGFEFKPRKVFWTNIDFFSVERTWRIGMTIGITYKLNARKNQSAGALNRAFGAGGILMNVWSLKSELVLRELNDFRVRALDGSKASSDETDAGRKTL